MEVNKFTGLPCKQGLYDPRFETDACGVGFVVNIDGIRSEKVGESCAIHQPDAAAADDDDDGDDCSNNFQ